MEEQMNMEILKPEDYNSEPVFYCRSCLSLRIRGVDDCEYCDVCSSTDIGQCSIKEWEELYKSKFGHAYLDEYKERRYPDFFKQ